METENRTGDSQNPPATPAPVSLRRLYITAAILTVLTGLSFIWVSSPVGFLKASVIVGLVVGGLQIVVHRTGNSVLQLIITIIGAGAFRFIWDRYGLRNLPNHPDNFGISSQGVVILAAACSLAWLMYGIRSNRRGSARGSSDTAEHPV